MANEKGEVIYEVRADDGHLESDLEEARKKVEQSVEKGAEKTEKIEREKNDSIKKDQESVTEHHKKEKEQQEKKESSSARTFKELAKNVSSECKSQLSKTKDHAVEVISAISHPIKTVSSVVKDKAGKIKESFKSSFASAKESAISGMEKTANVILHPVESAKNAGESIKNSFQNAFGTVKEVAANIVSVSSKAIGTGLLAVGSSAVAVGGMAVKSATDMDQAMNQFISSTGKGAEEADKYQKVLEEIYKNNYGESFNDIGQAMAEITKQLGDMSDEKLQEVSESAFALRDTFEYEIPESTRAAKAMMDNFGISGEEAMSLIAAGAQNGLDYSGELLDSISEYSVQFAKVGLDADDMFKIFQKGAETGAWNLDKIGDAVKEMSIRVIDGSDTTKEGFETIGLNADEMAKKFAAGGDSAKEAFQQTIEALAGMEDPIAQNLAGVDLFGTMWEDLGPEVVTQLASIEEGAYDTADAMDQIKEVKYDDLGSMFEGLKRSVEMLLLPLGEELIPVMDELIDAILPVLQEALPPIIDTLGGIITQLSPMIEEILPMLLDLLNTLLPIVTIVFNEFARVAQVGIELVLKVLKNLIDFLKNVFTGNWKAAWENVKDIFKVIAESLAEIFKIPINWIIDKINSFIDGLNAIKIPEWVPVVGGKGFSIPHIPKLRVGMDFVPKDDFPALLHRGEAVLTAEENAKLQSIGGIDALYSAISSPSFEPSNTVTVENMGTGESIDYDRLGDAVADALIAGNVRFVIGEREFGRLEKELGE